MTNYGVGIDYEYNPVIGWVRPKAVASFNETFQTVPEAAQGSGRPTRIHGPACIWPDQRAGIDANIVVATGISQRDSLLVQLGDAVDVVLEPERRDTFPAIVLASAYLADKKGMQRDEVVLVLPVDPYADLSYFYALLQMERLITDEMANIALMGIKPTYPSAKYGYIIPRPDGVGVERFQEKPDEASAARLIAGGALWNGGVFAFKLGYLLDIASRYIPSATYEEVRSHFSLLPKISFDYEVVEKEESIALVEYLGEWRDLGPYPTEIMDDRAIGRVILADICENTHVIMTGIQLPF